MQKTRHLGRASSRSLPLSRFAAVYASQPTPTAAAMAISVDAPASDASYSDGAAPPLCHRTSAMTANKTATADVTQFFKN